MAETVRAYAGSGVEVAALIDVDSGLDKHTVRQIAAVAAAKEGADTIELGVPCDLLEVKKFRAIRDDLIGVVSSVREVRRDVTVNACIETVTIPLEEENLIFESICLAVRESGCDGIVASESRVGFAEVEKLHRFAGPLKICVHGGGHDESLWETMAKAGADRFFLPYFPIEYDF